MRKLTIGLLLIVTVLAGTAYALQRVDVIPLTKSVVDAATTVGVTATAVPATAMVGRRTVEFTNMGSVTVYAGSSTVSTSTGTPLFVNQSKAYDVSDGVIIYFISGTASQSIRSLELK